MASSSSLMASQALILRNPRFLSPQTTPTPSPSLPFPNPRTTLSLSLSSTPQKFRVFASSTPSSLEPIPTESPLTESTRTIASIIAIAVTVSRLLSKKLSNFAGKLKSFISSSPSPDELLAIHHMQDTVMCTAGPLFFAKIADITRNTDIPADKLSTPLTVVLMGVHKWLHIYHGVLLFRIMLSWFPNVTWERQPLTAIRDVSDPFLSIFRNIFPPLFNALDISPLFALGALQAMAYLTKKSAA